MKNIGISITRLEKIINMSYQSIDNIDKELNALHRKISNAEEDDISLLESQVETLVDSKLTALNIIQLFKDKIALLEDKLVEETHDIRLNDYDIRMYIEI